MIRRQRTVQPPRYASRPRAARRRRTLWNTVAGLTLLPVVVALLPGCSRSEGNPSEAPTAADVVRVTPVEVTPLAPSSFEELIRLTGTVAARRDVVLSAEEPGRVVRVHVDKGRRVRKGQLLMSIDDRLLRAEIAQAMADSVFAVDALERQEAVWENRIGTEIAVVERRHAVATAAARLQGLRTRLANTRILAPFDGILDARYVDANETATLGAPLVRVLDPRILDIEIGVPERFAADVLVGTPARITFDVLPERTFEGQVRFVGSAVDPQSRTFPAEVRLENPNGTIKPAMVANVQLVRRTFVDVLVVPQEALRYTENGYVAYVAREDSAGAVAEERRVEVGASYANRVVILAGLQPGDRLITRGQLLVADGGRIDIVSSGSGVLQ